VSSALIETLQLFASLLRIAVIGQFVLSLLLTFNVVSLNNRYVEGLWSGINMLLDPILRPIRRIMPDTGQIDFSPMVLLLLISLFQSILH
jgi:YggT family protein